MTDVQGLTSVEVADRVARGLVNVSHDKTSRSLWDIIRTNVFTRFNALLTVLFIVILFVGQLIDGLFFTAVIVNSLVGIIQELRAKRMLDKLSILTAPQVTVKRDGKTDTILSSEVVQDDLVEIKAGDQVPADGTVISSEAVEIDESLLTGESDAIVKQPGDVVLSGSVVVAGSCWMKVTAVGSEAYAHKLAAEVKKFKKTKSELLEGTNKLLGYISIILVLVAPLLVWGQLTRAHNSFPEAMVRSIAAITGMIPEGLVVLTSFAFVLASLTLARRRVLVQELPAVEGLARVDVLCFDKTGTLTEGKVVFNRLEVLEHAEVSSAENALALFAKKADSPTLMALHEAFPKTTLSQTSEVPFSSKRKWSAVNEWVLGAPETLFPDSEGQVQQHAQIFAAKGERVLVLAKSASVLKSSSLPKSLKPIALVVLQEKIRDDVRDTLAYFAGQGVDLKVISGDNPRTVAAVAERVGFENVRAFDARELPTDPQKVADILASHNVFGRVLPEQKRLFVRSLQQAGHVVAMTGDGVNDALALKDADIGIAMGNGAPATKSSAQLVLLDNQFVELPQVLSEGRRVIANIERVANLFVIKNVYNLLFALAVTVFALSFPFLPRQMSLVSWLTVGIPAFFLSLGPNSRRYIPGFLPRVLRFAIPVGVLTTIAAFFTFYTVYTDVVHAHAASSAALITIMTIGFWVLGCLARPLKPWKVALLVSLVVLFLAAITRVWFRNFLELPVLFGESLFGFAIGSIAVIFVELLWRFDQRS